MQKPTLELSLPPGRRRQRPDLFEMRGPRRRSAEARGSVTLQLVDFVLDAQLLTLQIGDRVLVRKGTPILFIDGALKCGMLLFQRLDAILQQHARSSI